jgi:hypothetical protein
VLHDSTNDCGVILFKACEKKKVIKHRLEYMEARWDSDYIIALFICVFYFFLLKEKWKYCLKTFYYLVYVIEPSFELVKRWCMLYLHVLQLCIASEGKMDLTSLSKLLLCMKKVGCNTTTHPGIDILPELDHWNFLSLQNLMTALNYKRNIRVLNNYR